jgi:hypothetical protein
VQQQQQSSSSSSSSRVFECREDACVGLNKYSRGAVSAPALVTYGCSDDASEHIQLQQM